MQKLFLFLIWNDRLVSNFLIFQLNLWSSKLDKNCDNENQWRKLKREFSYVAYVCMYVRYVCKCLRIWFYVTSERYGSRRLTSWILYHFSFFLLHERIIWDYFTIGFCYSAKITLPSDLFFKYVIAKKITFFKDRTRLSSVKNLYRSNELLIIKIE